MRTVDRILVIDDDVELCSLVSEYLQPEGFQVESVHDGERGLARALSGDHLLIVLDVMLPGMNGLDAASRITESQPDIPVILFSLHLSEDVISHFQKDGIRGAVSKGDAARDLVAAVETVLSGGNFFPSRKSSGKLLH